MAAVQTPPRPVPGIWPQTPAPRSQPPPPSFSTPYPQSGPPTQSQQTPQSSAVVRTQPSQPPVSRPPEILRPAERAARSINEALAGDARFPELDNYLTQGYSSEYELQSAAAWAPFHKVRMHNIPDQIFEQYNRAQVSTSMGLFAELGYAWVAIDNALYMWDYTNPSPELLGFEDQPNSITAVKLIVPRAGVFLPTIKHALVLATTTEVMMLGLGPESGPGATGGLSLFQTGISVSVRGLDVSVITSSTKSGRVFFGGRTDNDVYELRYQQEERWFSNRSTKICHTSGILSSFTIAFATKRTENVEQLLVDDSRDLLYTLSSQSAIRAFLHKAGWWNKPSCNEASCRHIWEHSSYNQPKRDHQFENQAGFYFGCASGRGCPLSSGCHDRHGLSNLFKRHEFRILDCVTEFDNKFNQHAGSTCQNSSHHESTFRAYSELSQPGHDRAGIECQPTYQDSSTDTYGRAISARILLLLYDS